MDSIILFPAYGRDYSSKRACLDDWNAGKDFYAITPCTCGYISKNDREAKTFTSIEFRYKNKTKSFFYHME